MDYDIVYPIDNHRVGHYGFYAWIPLLLYLLRPTHNTTRHKVQKQEVDKPTLGQRTRLQKVWHYNVDRYSLTWSMDTTSAYLAFMSNKFILWVVCPRSKVHSWITLTLKL